MTPLRGAETLSLRWEVPPTEDGGFFDFLTHGNTERGMAYNAVTNRVLVVSRAGGTGIYVLEAGDADFTATLNTSGISGGLFDLNIIGVGDDGVIYACPLALATTSDASGAKTFKIYRWADDDPNTTLTVAWEGDPAGEDEAGVSLNLQRWGDTMAVRGAGANTQIVVPSRASPAVALFTTTDGIEFAPTIFPDAGSASGTLGVAFGQGDTLYLKMSSQPLRHVAFDLGAGTTTLLQSHNTLAAEARAIAIDPAENRLGVLVTGNSAVDETQLYDVTETTLPPIFSDSETLSTDNPNPNATGAVAFGPDVMFVLATNNGIAAYNIIDDNQDAPPAIADEPDSQTVIEGGPVEFSVVVSGTPPFTFQWSKDGDPIDGATGSSYAIAEVSQPHEGDYTVTVTNTAGMATSAPATLTVNPRVDSPLGQIKWRVAVDDRPYLSDGNLERGLALNPVTGRVLVATRSDGVQIRVLDGATGADLHGLNMTGVGGAAGETYAINVVTAAADGAIYAANLSLNGSQFRIYRWADDSPGTVATIAFDAAFSGAPVSGQRFGDTLSARGSGTDTQIIAAARLSDNVAIFTTADGTNFTANPVTTPGITPGVGLGVAFDNGDVFWGKDGGGSLYQVEFDLFSGTGTILNTFTTAQFPGSISAIAVDPVARLLAGVSNENPDNVQIYDISDLTAPPVLLDQELFATDNVNTFGLGALAFGPGCLAALGANNGLLALTIDSDAEPLLAPTISGVMLVGGGTQFQFTLHGQDGGTYRIDASPTLEGATWTELQTVTLTGTSSQTFTFAVSLDRRHFRATRLN